MHERTHTETLTEKRGNIIITRGMRIFSRTLGISGKCDVLEFHMDNSGVEINGWEGRYIPLPVEYKRGKPKKDNCDAAQLCAQAMCLEEMLCTHIEDGSLFYGETNHRTPVKFTTELRLLVSSSIYEMHMLYSRGNTPVVKPRKSCNSCSLKDICLPSIGKAGSAIAYISRLTEE